MFMGLSGSRDKNRSISSAIIHLNQPVFMLFSNTTPCPLDRLSSSKIQANVASNNLII